MARQLTMQTWIDEREIAARLGLSRREAHALRQNLPAEAWRRAEKGRVEWSASAVEEAATWLAQQAPEFRSTLATELATVKTPAASEQLTVARAQFPNTQVIECARATGERVLVRVRDSKNFRPTLHNGKPMTVAARCVNGQWWLQGPCPRWPGKW